MKTQGERQDFMWRPNDNSSTTLARYDQEAEHWTRAFKNANSPKPTFGGTMGTIGLVLQLAIILVWFIFSGISSILVWLFEPKNRVYENEVVLVNDMPSDDELYKAFSNPTIVNIDEEIINLNE